MSNNHDYKAAASSEIFLEQRLSCLVAKACNHQAGSAERQKTLTQIIRLIQNKLWKENTPYYQDALQQTWLYFCQNIGEGNTRKSDDYNHSSTVIGLNLYLRQRLRDFYINTEKEELTKDSMPGKYLDSGEPNQTVDSVENIPAKPNGSPLLEEVKQWVETDPEGELRCLHITERPEVTCQVLILRRLPPEDSWQTLAAEFNLPISTLSSFYQHQCLPCLRKFSEYQGYLEHEL